MKPIPLIGIAAWSGEGKTTFIEKLIPVLGERNIRTAVIKHDIHGIVMDHEGKDSWRFTKAGAKVCIVGQPGQTVIMENRPLDFYEAVRRIHDVDLILVEGYKRENIPQIGLCRKANQKGFVAPLDRFMAVVTDMELPSADIPRFGLEDIEAAADFILEHMDVLKAWDVRSAVKSEKEYHPDLIQSAQPPSMDAWLREAKTSAAAKDCGMFLFHNGIVRQTAKAKVRMGAEDTRPVKSMLFSYDGEKAARAIEEAYAMDGIYYIRLWLAEGELTVGDDIMLVLVGGDIRPHVVDALQALVGKLKNDCVEETELYQ